jgi:protoporphyrin/coproporphyrin ferrochelatase
MTAVLLLAHGTPESLDEMPEYLTRVRGGRPAGPELLDEMRRNYAAIGGRSPLTDLTRAQAEALRAELGAGARVYVGMRNWRPFIADAVAAAVADGVTDLVALPMAPQYSALSVGKYAEAVRQAAPSGLRVRFVESWHDHPGLVAAFAEKLEEALRRDPGAAVIFTAHSLPERIVREGDAYPGQVARTAAAVAARAGVSTYRLAYQSAGRTPEPWLGPSLEEAMEAAAREGTARVLVAPIGFVCDHTEILFDIDVAAAAAAGRRGIALSRTGSLNTSPTFIRALADIVRAAGG